ncbi:hypothetical protein [Candidatus Clavichlamydia salmonicola]|uniref:hypothetical protein n=1 Tax=Candidatus Clavichlamydia salmonicola TaxID=469812 RepID=UPI001891D032|nr:hypothetical protein [Candidatus Clavichlamydia salmonicola]
MHLSQKDHSMITEDGLIIHISKETSLQIDTQVFFNYISPTFLGHTLPKNLLSFNLKSVLAQLGIEAICNEITFNKEELSAIAEVSFIAFGMPGIAILKQLGLGSLVGKLFCADDRRLIRSIDELMAMQAINSYLGLPLVDWKNSKKLFPYVSIKDDRAIAYPDLLAGTWVYDNYKTLPMDIIGQSLKEGISYRPFLKLHQNRKTYLKRKITPGEMLLVKTLPFHISCTFVRVAHDQLPIGFNHTSADLLLPESTYSGEIYELYGESKEEITHIPLEFFKVEYKKSFTTVKNSYPFLLDKLSFETVHAIFQSAPKNISAALFISAHTLLPPQAEYWSTASSISSHSLNIDSIENQLTTDPCYHILKKIEVALFQEEGSLFLTYLPSPLIKSLLISFAIRKHLKRLFFKFSDNKMHYLSKEEKILLNDLHNFGIIVTEVNLEKKSLRDYLPHEYGRALFVPTEKKEALKKAIFFGIYGSHLPTTINKQDEIELFKFFKELPIIQNNSSHPLFNKNHSIAIITGEGDGAMNVGQRIAKKYNFLSCSNQVNFEENLAPSTENRRYITADSSMSYLLEEYLDSEKNLYANFPIFLKGGIGSDLELAMEENLVALKIKPCIPILLFGPPSFWIEKMAPRFQSNLKNKTNTNSLWIYNLFFSVQTAEAALSIYSDFLTHKFLLGPTIPPALNSFRHLIT